MSSNAIELSTKLWKECHLAVRQTSDCVRWLSKLVGLLITCLLVEATLAQNEPQGDLPFAVPDGFRVSRVADDALAHDCFCMTLDGQGRPVISGPGYLRTLVDQDNDGVFDRAIEWTKSIKAGAQGLWFEKSTLYYVSDGGLWKSQDNNSDAIADGNPTRVLEIPTGGEHDSHAIRRGPDGYWT